MEVALHSGRWTRTFLKPLETVAPLSWPLHFITPAPSSHSVLLNTNYVHDEPKMCHTSTLHMHTLPGRQEKNFFVCKVPYFCLWYREVARYSSFLALDSPGSEDFYIIRNYHPSRIQSININIRFSDVVSNTVILLELSQRTTKGFCATSFRSLGVSLDCPMTNKTLTTYHTSYWQESSRLDTQAHKTTQVWKLLIVRRHSPPQVEEAGRQANINIKYFFLHKS